MQVAVEQVYPFDSAQDWRETQRVDGARFGKLGSPAFSPSRVMAAWLGWR